MPLATASAPVAPFERGHPLLEHGGGRVADARVDVAVLLQLEKLRGLIGAVEDVGGRLVNRHGARAGLGVGHVAGMDHAGLETESSSRWGLPSTGRRRFAAPWRLRAST
jgi:hypothetical protein